MPIAALFERGLFIDVFGSTPTLLKSTAYKTNNNRLVSVFNSVVKFINLLDLKDTVEAIIPGFVDIKMSSDGSKVLILCYNKVLAVFNGGKQIAEFENVENYDVSDSFYSFSTKSMAKIFSFPDNTLLYESSMEIKAIHCQTTFVLLVTEKNTSQKIYLFKGQKIFTLLELPNIYRTLLRATKDEENALLLVDVEYSKTSYYAESSLYFLKFGLCDSIAMKSPKAPSNKNADSSSKTEQSVSDPQLLHHNTVFSLFTYKLLRKIHDFGFVNQSFYVCFGDQPAYLHVYTLDGEFVRKHPKAIRNQVFFNRKMNRVINAGLGNLPGNIEVFSDDVRTCKFESLGASIVSWMNDETHFMVATTNYFKSDNRITVYDYYGRAIETMECESLENASVYGLNEKESCVEPLAQPKAEVMQQAYVPPHLQSKRTSASSLAKKTVIPLKSVMPKRTHESIQKELEDCLKAKEKLEMGEELGLEEENKIFRIKTLREELEKLKKIDF